MLDNLPPARRDHLLRYYGWKFGYEPDDVARFVVERAATPCSLGGGAPPVTVAHLGDDGRYHLCAGDRPMCAGRRVSGHAARYHHRSSCSWWYVDGDRRFTVSRLPDTDYHEVIAAWTVQLVGEGVPADSIAVHLRCPVPTPSRWPRVAAATTPVARIRALLIEAFGHGCALCGTTAQNVDHDHGTGLVRGLLCEFCNVVVDHCPHTEGCPAADYLTNPPAGPLAITYPNRGRKTVRPMPDATQRRARREELAALRQEREASHQVR